MTMFSKDQVINNLRAEKDKLEGKLEAIRDVVGSDLSNFDIIKAVEDILMDEAQKPAPTVRKLK